MCDQNPQGAIGPEQKARYLGSDDPRCPFCGSDQIEYVDYPEILKDSGLVRERCLTCNSRWALRLRVLDLTCEQAPEAPAPAAAPAVEHKIIDPHECPQCGGRNTEGGGREGPTEYRLCLDCDGKEEASPASINPWYFISHSDAIQSVNWNDGEDTVYDTEHLAQQEAMNLLRVLSRAHDRGYFDPHPDDSEEEAAKKREALEVLARAKGESS